MSNALGNVGWELTHSELNLGLERLSRGPLPLG